MPMPDFSIRALSLGKPLWSWTPGPQANDNPGGTGEVQGNPNDALRNLFGLMRKIHGYRQQMGNYSSDGGQQ